MLSILERLGPAPKSTATHTKGSTFKLFFPNLIDSASQDKDLMSHVLVAETSEVYGEVDVATLEKARFLYQGPPTLKGLPVFYVIFNRWCKKTFQN